MQGYKQIILQSKEFTPLKIPNPAIHFIFRFLQIEIRKNLIYYTYITKQTLTRKIKRLTRTAKL
jgi:hypothetical protein